MSETTKTQVISKNGYFASFLKKKYGFVNYTNVDDPLVIYCPFIIHAKTIKAHKGRIILVWAGTEAEIRYPSTEKKKKFVGFLKKFDNITHVSVSRFVNSDLEHYGFNYEFIPIAPTISLDSGLFSPVKKGNSIYIYSTTNKERYGGNWYKQLPKLFPHLNFIYGTNPIAYESAPSNFKKQFVAYSTLEETIEKIYKRCFICLRLTQHDGNSSTVQELGLLGIKSVHNGCQPSAINYEDFYDIVKAVQEEEKTIGTADEELHIKMVEFTKKDQFGEWCNLVNT